MLSELSTMPGKFSIRHSRYSTNDINDKYHYSSPFIEDVWMYVDFSSSFKNNIGSSVRCSLTT